MTNDAKILLYFAFLLKYFNKVSLITMNLRQIFSQIPYFIKLL